MALPRLFREPFRRQAPNWRMHLRDWFSGPAGSRLLEAQEAVLDEVTPCIFGYHAVQVCTVRDHSLLKQSRIRQRLLAGTDPERAQGVDFLCDPARLPLANDGTDLIVLHHALDFEDDPHTVLREAARALIPGGALVVVGFNPWSIFGLLRPFHLHALDAPWFARAISAWRVSDWLRVLDLRVDGVEYGYHLPPLDGDVSVRRLGWLSWLGQRLLPASGMFYVLVARKAVAPLTPVRRLARQSMPTVPVAVPAASRVNRRDGFTPERE